MKVCVTGGAGFIGSHLADALVERGDDVVIVDNLSTGFLKNIDHLKDKIEFLEGSAGDLSLMKKACQDVDVLFHQAALTSVPRSMEDPLRTHEETLTAAVVCLEACRQAGVPRFVYASSSSIYGDHPGDTKDESLPYLPRSPYAGAKASVELMAASYSRGFNMSTVGLRYFNVFGPRQDPKSSYAAVIPRFIKSLMAGEPPTITGDGDQSRDFTYVANVVSANLLAAEAPDSVGSMAFNVACGQRVTLPQLVDELNKVANTNLAPLFVDARPGDIRHSLADISLARKHLGFEPLVGFTEGLQKTWESACRNWQA